MASVVYSYRFLSAANADPEALFIVPVGYVAVVRDLDAVLSPAGATVFQLFVAGAQVFIAQFGIELSYSNIEWRGRQVAFPGETIAVYVDNDCSVSVSGYLLLNP